MVAVLTAFRRVGDCSHCGYGTVIAVIARCSGLRVGIAKHCVNVHAAEILLVAEGGQPAVSGVVGFVCGAVVELSWEYISFCRMGTGFCDVVVVECNVEFVVVHLDLVHHDLFVRRPME